MIAAATKKVAFIEPFLSSGKADFTLTSASGDNVLIYASNNTSQNRDEKSMLLRLLEARPPVEIINAPGADGNSLIFKLLAKVNSFNKYDQAFEQVLKQLKSLNADFNLMDKEGYTVLQRGITNDKRNLSFNLENAGLLLDCGAKVWTKNKEGDSALHFLLDFNLKDDNSLQLLARFCAQGELESRDSQGNTALLRLFTSVKGIKSESYLEKALLLLLEQQAKTDAVNQAGLNVMMAAAARGCNKCVLKLLEINAPLHSDKAPYPILFYAATGNLKQDALEGLIKAGANVNAVDPNNGMTPLLVALLSSVNNSFIDTLIKHGADVNQADQQGHTPLMAMGIGDPTSKIVRSLIKAGANRLAKDAEGHNALYYLENSVMYTHPKYAKECQEVKGYLTGEKEL